MDKIFREMIKHYHFIGIGGIGMGAIASLLLDKGFKVTGSDIRTNKITDRLKTKGAGIFIGHAVDNVKGGDVVVISSAIDDDNVELCFAKSKGIVIMKRAEALAMLMEEYVSITVAGAHGKTTTTSMASSMLEFAGLKPTTAVGGIVKSISSNANLGEGKYFVAEVDESDGSFLNFNPKYSIITNIDLEHLDHYKSLDDILDIYNAFVEKTETSGKLIVCGDDERLMAIAESSDKDYFSYGLSENCHLSANNLLEKGSSVRFSCSTKEESLGEFEVEMPGKHNVLNALACISLGLILSIEIDTIRESLKNYLGVERRFQIKYSNDGVMVVDDYAHHPTEIKATLKAARSFMVANDESSISYSRLVVIFQPHRFTRLKYLFDEFVDSLTCCDKLIVTDIYAASESPIEGVSSEVLVNSIKKRTDIEVDYSGKENLIATLENIVSVGDIVLMLGAGDITKICDNFVSKLTTYKQSAV